MTGTNAARAYGALCIAAATGMVAEHFAFSNFEVLALAFFVGLGVFLLNVRT
jgi:hypothetical protein